MKKAIGVIGSGETLDDKHYSTAYETGELIAKNGAVLITGGLGGVMEAASKGASDNSGTTVGILPDSDPDTANPYISIPIPTGMGKTRNALVIQSSFSVIALPGGYGTLSEISIALNLSKRIVFLPGAWDLRKCGKIDHSLFKEAVDPYHAVGLALNSK